MPSITSPGSTRSTRSSIPRHHDGGAAGQRGSGAVTSGILSWQSVILSVAKDLSNDIPLWAPDPERIARANLTAFIQHIQAKQPAGAERVEDFASLYQWSVAHPEAFW